MNCWAFNADQLEATMKAWFERVKGNARTDGQLRWIDLNGDYVKIFITAFLESAEAEKLRIVSASEAEKQTRVVIRGGVVNFEDIIAAPHLAEQPSPATPEFLKRRPKEEPVDVKTALDPKAAWPFPKT